MNGIEWTPFKIGLAIFGIIFLLGTIAALIGLWFYWNPKEERKARPNWKNRKAARILKRKRKSKRQQIAELTLARDLLLEMNQRLTTGESIQLTIEERRIILLALERPRKYDDLIEQPPKKRIFRELRDRIREKIKLSLKEDT